MPDEQPSVDLHQERLVPTILRRPYRRLRVAKRIVTEQQTITVDVRREELVIEELDVASGSTGNEAAGATETPEPVVLVLSREVPGEVVLRTEPVEMVRVHVERSTRLDSVSAPVSHEEVEVTADGDVRTERGAAR